MANVADLKLIKINNFPEVESPEDWIVVSDAAGLGYKISKENFKAFLGTVTVTAPKPIKPTDPAPTLDGVYIPEIDGTYANLGGIVVDRSEGGEDYGKSVTVLKNGSQFVKVSEPLPQADLSGVVAKSDITTTSLFNPSQKTDGFYIASGGVITESIGSSYGRTPVTYSAGRRLYLNFSTDSGDVARRVVFLNSVGGIVGSVAIQTVGLFMDIPMPDGAVEVIYTIDKPGNTVKVDLNKLYVGYEPFGIFIDEIYGVKVEASSLAENSAIKKIISDQNPIKRVAFPRNLINPATVHADSTVNSSGVPVYSASDLYHAPDPIPVELGQYSFNTRAGRTDPVRSYRTLDGNGIINGAISSPSPFRNITIDNPSVRYIIPLFYSNFGTGAGDLGFESGFNSTFKEYTESSGYEYIADGYGGAENPNSLMSKKSVEDLLNSGGADSTVVNISNSDKILFVGSSSVEGYYQPDRKLWANRLQDFLDIIFVPYGWSGNDANTLADKLYSDTPSGSANGVKPSEINPTIVFVGQTLNSVAMIDDPYDTAFIESNEKLLKTAITVTGAKPIFGTMYRTENRPWIENSLKELADKWNADFIPVGSYTNIIRNEKYAGFYGSGHPGVRTNESYTLYLLEYISKLDRPKQSILIFEARDSALGITALTYKDNFERAEKFRTIQVGEKTFAPIDQSRYDSMLPVNYAITGNNHSDYMKLLKGQSVSLKDKFVIEVIIPKVRPTSVKIDLVSTGIASYYLFNNYNYTWDLVTTLENIERKYIEFDKIKVLCVGSGITLSDVSATVTGGVDKPVQPSVKLNGYKGGKHVFGGTGFDATTLPSYTLGANTFYNRLTTYGVDFADNPKYLGDTKDIIVLSDTLKRQFTIENESTFGYKTLRIWTCARLNPKIYNPTEFANWAGGENPFTNVSWNAPDKYDYDDLNIVVRHLGVTYSDQAKSINVRKVGLFWSLLYVDVLIPILSDGSYELQISRGSSFNDYPMEICDVKVEMI